MGNAATLTRRPCRIAPTTHRGDPACLTSGQIRFGGPSQRTWLDARAFEAWRHAEELVANRWKTYVSADPETRRGAFAAYVVALNAEALAAEELATAYLAQAA